MAASSQRHARNCEAAERTRAVALILLVLLLAILQGPAPCRATFVSYGTSSSSSLPFRIGFYSSSCPMAETIINNVFMTSFNADVKVPAQLIRQFFHECFVTGCDGSLLVNSTSSNQAEKTAGPNLSVAAYDVIDAAKAALEATCPGVVSCADIQVLITRDAINLLGGGYFQVPTGRLDTRAVTTASQASNTLPAHTDSAQQAIATFGAQGFSASEFVTLIGAHTVGAAFCQTISYRLYNYQNTNQAQTNMDPNLVTTLQGICPNPNSPIFPDPAVALDQGPIANTINAIDNSYYQQLQLGHGILEVDQNIGMSNITGPFVTAYAGNGTSSPPTKAFAPSFANAIIKMGTLNVITGSPGSQGSIRQNCAILN